MLLIPGTICSGKVEPEGERVPFARLLRRAHRTVLQVQRECRRHVASAHQSRHVSFAYCHRLPSASETLVPRFFELQRPIDKLSPHDVELTFATKLYRDFTSVALGWCACHRLGPV